MPSAITIIGHIFNSYNHSLSGNLVGTGQVGYNYRHIAAVII